MNDERFENNTISPENLILPEKVFTGSGFIEV